MLQSAINPLTPATRANVAPIGLMSVGKNANDQFHAVRRRRCWTSAHTVEPTGRRLV
jgi:hypothetical protein